VMSRDEEHVCSSFLKEPEHDDGGDLRAAVELLTVGVGRGAAPALWRR
jgi:hypothetical protein